MTTKKRAKAAQVSQPQISSEAFNVQKVFHVVTDAREHFFAQSKTELLSYLAKKPFSCVAVNYEEIPVKTIYGV